MKAPQQFDNNCYNMYINRVSVVFVNIEQKRAELEITKKVTFQSLYCCNFPTNHILMGK